MPVFSSKITIPWNVSNRLVGPVKLHILYYTLSCGLFGESVWHQGAKINLWKLIWLSYLIYSLYFMDIKATLQCETQLGSSPLPEARISSPLPEARISSPLPEARISISRPLASHWRRILILCSNLSLLLTKSLFLLSNPSKPCKQLFRTVLTKSPNQFILLNSTTSKRKINSANHDAPHNAIVLRPVTFLFIFNKM